MSYNTANTFEPTEALQVNKNFSEELASTDGTSPTSTQDAARIIN
jgi:hypothetical protein